MCYCKKNKFIKKKLWICLLNLNIKITLNWDFHYLFSSKLATLEIYFLRDRVNTLKIFRSLLFLWIYSLFAYVSSSDCFCNSFCENWLKEVYNIPDPLSTMNMLYIVEYIVCLPIATVIYTELLFLNALHVEFLLVNIYWKINLKKYLFYLYIGTLFNIL